MTALLPAAVFLGLLVLCKRRMRLRRAVLVSSVIWGGLVVVWTETLSLFGVLSASKLVFGWTVSLVILGFLAWFEGTKDTQQRLPDRWSWVVSSGRTHPASTALAFGCLVLLVGVLTVALLGAPNNGDSMSYHLPRVMHWIQNGTVRHYPTWIPRQLYQPPMAEFTILQFQLLYGSDRLANLVQWFALVGSGLAASLVAARLGAGRLGQIFGFLFVVTLPMGLLQGMTTQNDLVLAFWLAAGTYFCLEAFGRVRDGIAWESVLPLAACLGLAVLTKGTAYVLVPSLLLAVFVLALYRHGGRGLRVILICMMVILIINLGHYSRNMDAFGNILMPDDLPFAYRNRVLGVDVLLSNIVRNIALHFGTPFSWINQPMEAGIRRMHAWVGLSVNDPRITWRYSQFKLHFNVTDENHAHNPFHLLLIGICVGRFMFGERGQYPAREGWIVGGTLAAFLLFCAVLQWQPWNSRLQLPLFVSVAGFVGTQLEKGWPRFRVILISILLVVMGVWVVANNRSHPMVKTFGNPLLTSRMNQYFSNRPGLKSIYKSVSKRLETSSCRHFGLVLGLEDWEYPLWMLLNHSEIHSFRLTHYVPSNLEPQRTWHLVSSTTDSPCQLVSLGQGWSNMLRKDGWEMTKSFSAVSIWRRSSSSLQYSRDKKLLDSRLRESL